jgi:hypothetical protein
MSSVLMNWFVLLFLSIVAPHFTTVGKAVQMLSLRIKVLLQFLKDHKEGTLLLPRSMGVGSNYRCCKSPI